MTRKRIALLPVVCSQAHLLTYANICCTSEHLVKRDSLGLRLALLLGVDHSAISLLTACVSEQPVTHSHEPSPVHSHVWKGRAKYSS